MKSHSSGILFVYSNIDGFPIYCDLDELVSELMCSTEGVLGEEQGNSSVGSHKSLNEGKLAEHASLPKTIGSTLKKYRLYFF